MSNIVFGYDNFQQYIKVAWC